ncbi:MAG TPA: hypothetical protein VHB30_10305 [Solirubrobacteraceae bacterium]|nr:hypothetical protein [Solirubrobacteraceae bacterium]
MGLLDDAIRDHIELKRKHGAQPGEIARLEQEAFGAVRRGLDLEAGHEGGPATPHLHLAEDPVGVTRHDGPELLDGPPRPHGDPADHLARRPEPVHLEPDDELFEEEAEPEEAAPSAPLVDEADLQPTQAFDAEEVRAATAAADAEPAAVDEPETAEHGHDQDEHAEEGDELLEETPEFLQETPEHDRLWFEQRPPRDFDF